MGRSTITRCGRFRFSLRLLFVVVLLFGVGLGWVGGQLRWIHQREEALRWIRPLRARQESATKGLSIPPAKGFWVTHRGPYAPWNLALFGEQGVKVIEMDPRYLDAENRYSMDRLQSLFPEAEITVGRPKNDGSSAKGQKEVLIDNTE